MSDEVLTERAGNILIITLNRPKVRNAVNEAAAHAVAAAADLLDEDPGLAQVSSPGRKAPSAPGWT